MDLMTSDPEAAEGFYTKIAGWGTEVWEGGEMPYKMFTNSGDALGGVMKLPEEAKKMGAPPHWIAYVAVPDTDATVARAQELGAQTYVEPTDIPSVGKFAVLADPQGATFAVFTSAEPPPGSDEPPKKGEFSWHELATTDYEAAFDFYTDLFGWQKTDAMDMGEAGIYQMYGRGSHPLGGMYNKPAEMPAPPHWLHYFMIDDVNKSVETVKELGGQILNGPMEVPGGDLIAQCLDPQGAAFAIHSLASGQ
jgi:predicted enzyme related to lactoylglutathione lyase